MRALAGVLAACVVPVGLGGCSLATSYMADAMSGSSGAYGRDDDPELIAAAAPFGLKTMETLLESEPEHVGLLTALASGFVQYGFGFVDLEADRVAGDDIELALEKKQRARKLYLRARGYALRGLEVDYEGFEQALRADPASVLPRMTEDDVPLLYWSAAAWGLAIAVSKNEPDLIADLPVVVALASRAIELDEAYKQGALHELFISLEAAVPGGDLDKATRHFERAVVLSEGKKAGPYVSYAEGVVVKKQDARAFHTLLNKALAVDLEASPDDRLVNTMMQRKATWLKASSEDLFLEDVDPAEAKTLGLEQ